MMMRARVRVKYSGPCPRVAEEDKALGQHITSPTTAALFVLGLKIALKRAESTPRVRQQSCDVSQ